MPWTMAHPSRSVKCIIAISLSESSLIKDLRGPPQGVFSFARPVHPHRLGRVGPQLRLGAFLFSMSASLNCARSSASPFLEATIAQVPRICKQNVEKTPKRPEFRAFGDAIARPRLRTRNSGRNPWCAPHRKDLGPSSCENFSARLSHCRQAFGKARFPFRPPVIGRATSGLRRGEAKKSRRRA